MAANSCAPVRPLTQFDPELIRKAMTRDNQALTALHDKYHGLVLYKLTNMSQSAGYSREFIEDTSQDVWVKICQNIDKLEYPEKFNAWLNEIVKNTFLNKIKSPYSKLDFIAIGADGRTKDQDFGPVVYSELTVPPRRWVRSDLLDIHTRLKAALTELSPKQQTIFRLRYEDGLATTDIANSLKMPDVTVRRTLNYIREQLCAHFPDRLGLNEFL